MDAILVWAAIITAGLGDPSFEKRQAASEILEKAPAAALPYLFLGTLSEDAEIRFRADRAMACVTVEAWRPLFDEWDKRRWPWSDSVMTGLVGLADDPQHLFQMSDMAYTMAGPTADQCPGDHTRHRNATRIMVGMMRDAGWAQSEVRKLLLEMEVRCDRYRRIGQYQEKEEP